MAGFKNLGESVFLKISILLQGYLKNKNIFAILSSLKEERGFFSHPTMCLIKKH